MRLTRFYWGSIDSGDVSLAINTAVKNLAYRPWNHIPLHWTRSKLAKGKQLSNAGLARPSGYLGRHVDIFAEFLPVECRVIFFWFVGRVRGSFVLLVVVVFMVMMMMMAVLAAFLRFLWIFYVWFRDTFVFLSWIRLRVVFFFLFIVFFIFSFWFFSVCFRIFCFVRLLFTIVFLSGSFFLICYFVAGWNKTWDWNQLAKYQEAWYLLYPSRSRIQKSLQPSSG